MLEAMVTCARGWGRARAEQRCVLSLGHETALEQPPQPARRVQRREGVVDACPPEKGGGGAGSNSSSLWAAACLRSLVHHGAAPSRLSWRRASLVAPCLSHGARPPRLTTLLVFLGRLATRRYSVTAVLASATTVPLGATV